MKPYDRLTLIYERRQQEAEVLEHLLFMYLTQADAPIMPNPLPMAEYCVAIDVAEMTRELLISNYNLLLRPMLLNLAWSIVHKGVGWEQITQVLHGIHYCIKADRNFYTIYVKYKPEVTKAKEAKK